MHEAEGFSSIAHRVYFEPGFASHGLDDLLGLFRGQSILIRQGVDPGSYEVLVPAHFLNHRLTRSVSEDWRYETECESNKSTFKIRDKPIR